MHLSLESPRYFKLSCDLIICFLHLTLKCELLSFLRGTKRTHSVFPKCKGNVLSISQFEHDSITLDNFV